MKVLSVVAAGDFPEQQEVALADGLSEFLHGAAEVAPVFAVHVLQRVDAQPVTVGEGYPVLIDEDQSRQRVSALHGQVAQHLEIGALVLGVGISEVATHQGFPFQPVCSFR